MIGKQRKMLKKGHDTPTVLEFFKSLPEKQGWTLLQFNFTVGVRGSISNVNRTEPLSFLSTFSDDDDPLRVIICCS